MDVSASRGRARPRSHAARCGRVRPAAPPVVYVAGRAGVPAQRTGEQVAGPGTEPIAQRGGAFAAALIAALVILLCGAGLVGAGLVIGANRAPSGPVTTPHTYGPPCAGSGGAVCR